MTPDTTVLPPQPEAGRPPSSAAPAVNRRRATVIDGFQARFVTAQLLWTGILLVGFAAMLLGPTVYDLVAGDEREQLSAATLFLQFHLRLWPALIALGATLTAVTVTLSHRVAGPLYRFRVVFEAVTRGELWVHSKIRTKDYPVLEGQALERMMETLRRRIGDAQQALRDADAATTRPDAAGAAELKAALDRARMALAVYELAPPAKSARGPAASSPAAPAEARASHPSNAGFTLIELILVTGLIATMAAIAVPTYNAVLEKARVTRAVGDVRSLEREVQSHFMLYDCHPTLDELGYRQIRDPWGNQYVLNVLAAGAGRGGGGGNGGGGGGEGGGQPPAGCTACNGVCVGRGDARKDRNLVPINSDFDFFSKGKDQRTTPALNAQDSRDDIIRAADGGYIGLSTGF